MGNLAETSAKIAETSVFFFQKSDFHACFLGVETSAQGVYLK